MGDLFAGRAAIVTGASSGIGRLIAIELAKAGMETWLVGRSETELDATAILIEESDGPKAHCAPMELSQRGVLADLVAEVGTTHPYLFALINNAAVMYPEPLVESDIDRMYALMAINLLTPMESCRAAVQQMRKHGNPGHLINISSLAGQHDAYGAYSVSKAGIDRLGQVLRRELERDDIRATNIIPGGFTTNLGRGLLPETQEQMAEAVGKLGINPAGPDAAKLMGDPQEVANVVRYVLERPIALNLSEITIRPAVSLNID
jgi:NAD(P)-dependent dehydrogenase (short-subunit alcohol dehydrogenase family)|tara:strand:+ start:5779 stop:6564 length:786 start_codon:yes stop_codon:yes gene_type:complete